MYGFLRTFFVFAFFDQLKKEYVKITVKTSRILKSKLPPNCKLTKLTYLKRFRIFKVI